MLRSQLDQFHTPARDSAGPMRRLAVALRDRGQIRSNPVRSLHGLLPLRYPTDQGSPSRDDLTGLGSQPAFVDALTQGTRRFERDGTPFSLVLIDIDDLGVVNAREGHVQGDELLRRVARLMRDLSQPGDKLFRIGGDEFAMLLPGADPGEAASRSAHMLRSLERPVDETHVGGFSAGVAGVPWSTRQIGALYRQAAAALAWTKQRGRGAITVFDSRAHRLRGPADSTSDELVEKVVAGGSLRPVFQPIVDLHTGHVLGFEGLIRVDEVVSQQGTRELFAAAAASGRTTELDLACIDVLVSGARAIGSDRLLALNLSPQTLAGREFDPAWLLESLVQAGISPSRVVVELSDHETVEDLGRLRRAFSDLQRYGLRVAADDVGADDPGRHLLSHVPFDVVKIDLSRVWEGASSARHLALLRDAALSRHARVVVEGVETSEQLLAIRDLEIGAGQGYLLGRPGSSVGDRFVDVQRLEDRDAAWDDMSWPLTPTVEEPRPDVIPPERRAIFLPPVVQGLAPSPGAA